MVSTRKDSHLYIGIDPGLASTGWGLVQSDGGRLRCVDYGVVQTNADTQIGLRLRTIYDTICSVIDTFHPDGAGIEDLYFARNASSAIPVAQARGTILLALVQSEIPTTELAPHIVKQAVVGAGQADKEQVIQMVRVILGMKEVPRPNHAADALAIAVAAIHIGATRGAQNRV